MQAALRQKAPRSQPEPAVADPAAFEAHYRDRSLWLDGVREPLVPRSPLAGNIHCDVVIVGAGFTGLWSAYYLKRHAPSLRIVVLEREIAGFGPSGRNGGWASAGVPGRSAAYGEPAGSGAMIRAHRETQAAVDEIGKVAETHEIDCGYRKDGVLTITTTEPQRARLDEIVASSDRCSAGERLLAPAEIDRFTRIPGVVAAAHMPHGARIDPAKLARGLARVCEEVGVVIHERTEATDVSPGRVDCLQGTISADTVLRATESYTTRLPGQALTYLPLYSLMVATEPLPPEVWQQIGGSEGLLVGDLHHLFFYAQRTADGRIALGGRGAPYRLARPIDEGNERSARVFDRLTQAIRRHFPPAADATITHHWGGPLAVPRDWSMSVSFDPRTRIGWAGGYSGHGVVAANVAGRTLADFTLGRATDRTTLPWIQHRSRRWEPEPLRFLVSRSIVHVLEVADRVEDQRDRPAHRVRLVRPFMPTKH